MGMFPSDEANISPQTWKIRRNIWNLTDWSHVPGQWIRQKSEVNNYSSFWVIALWFEPLSLPACHAGWIGGACSMGRRVLLRWRAREASYAWVVEEYSGCITFVQVLMDLFAILDSFASLPLWFSSVLILLLFELLPCLGQYPNATHISFDVRGFWDDPDTHGAGCLPCQLFRNHSCLALRQLL